MIHLNADGFRAGDVSAVMLADGKWYPTSDPTMPNGPDGYLSFLQYNDPRSDRAVMVNVRVADIKAVAYFDQPRPEVQR